MILVLRVVGRFILGVLVFFRMEGRLIDCKRLNFIAKESALCMFTN